MRTKWERYSFRKQRVADRVGRHQSRPRLSVSCSLNHIYAQVINDVEGKTVAFACTLSKELKGQCKSTKAVDAAKKVGSLVAKKALEAGVKQVRFDRGARLYHGRVKALAEAAREAGLEF